MERSARNNMIALLAIWLALLMVTISFTIMLPSVGVADSINSHNLNSDGKNISQSKGSSVKHAREIDPQKAYHELKSLDIQNSAINGQYNVGDSASFLLGDWGKWYYNATDPNDYMIFTKRAETNTSEIWVAEDLSFMQGDERNSFSNQILVSDDKVEYLAHQFEDTIYPTVSKFVSSIPLKDGENSIPKSEGQPYFSTNISGKVMIMIFNIVDDAFLYPWYEEGGGSIMGMYNPSTTEYYDRNIIFLDSWDWNNRTGEQTDPSLAHYSYAYERTLAHEYQHLLNDYANPDQVAFLNEGCSILAGLLCGYSLDNNLINSFLATPDNSLTEWADQTLVNEGADYGAAGLFMIYLNDHFGIPIVRNMVDTKLIGVDAVNGAFKAIGKSDWTFDRAFKVWRLANLIRSNSPGGGLYNYKSIDLNDPQYSNITILNWKPSEDPRINSAADYFGRTYVPAWDYFLPTSKSGSYGSEYIKVVGADGGNWAEGLNSMNLKFGLQGQEQVSQGWQIIDRPIGMKDLVFSDDFDHGGALPGWATTSSGVSTNPWYRVNSGGGDYFAVANSDELGFDTIDMPMSERLYMTSGFSTLGLTELGLRLDVDFQKYWWKDVGKILFSVDSGNTWHQLTNYTEDTNEKGIMPFSTHSEVYLDLSRVCGKEDVRLAFDYYTSGWGLWFAIDNIEVGKIVKEKMWWSDAKGFNDFSMYANLDLTSLDRAVLGFDTQWTTEDGYDFGFVQVSSDGGSNWTSVSNEFTTNLTGFLPDPNIVKNLPGITGNSPFQNKGHVTYDLSAWAGQIVKVRIRYMTDWSITYEGWYIDNISLNGLILDDAWTHRSFFSDLPAININWMISIYLPGCVGKDGIRYLPIIMDLHNLGDTNNFLRNIGTYSIYQEMYLIISPNAGPSDYGFWMDNYMNP
jgi:hypothetical protein